MFSVLAKDASRINHLILKFNLALSIQSMYEYKFMIARSAPQSSSKFSAYYCQTYFAPLLVDHIFREQILRIHLDNGCLNNTHALHCHQAIPKAG